MNNTIPATCLGTEGSLPTLPHPMSCGISLHQNYTRNTLFPAPAFLSYCCDGQPTASFGDGSCWVYCNATSRAQESKIFSCLQSGNKTFTGFGCEGILHSDGSFTSNAPRVLGRWSKAVVLGVLASMVFQL
ncbi:hypothetical protein M430DRAFT_194505 [Amorphotheca resinae ATCC 22711]|uniref:Uncharacterized protein n=1 Tax=Amorphotheca resinae ATCC 22711 TaxID=857342 RepID=A0A2T3AP04_AMORE|nr:hypothetical protein M430DRAFT_194505 [Amorphotheca resinae ATCC 22711]PSS06658.1 hypothetical protein M430DRAFT_194505 [Amorphotheca resinae ATCC 22711]